MVRILSFKSHAYGARAPISRLLLSALFLLWYSRNFIRMNIGQRSLQNRSSPLFLKFLNSRLCSQSTQPPRFNKEKPKPDLRIFGALAALVITIVAVKLGGAGNPQPPPKLSPSTPPPKWKWNCNKFFSIFHHTFLIFFHSSDWDCIKLTERYWSIRTGIIYWSSQLKWSIHSINFIDNPRVFVKRINSQNIIELPIALRSLRCITCSSLYFVRRKET